MVTSRSTKAEILAEFNMISAEREILAESLDRSMAMLKQEDIGWLLQTGGTLRDQGGPTLEQLHRFSDIATEMVVANPLIKRGVGLRTSYVWSKEPTYSNFTTGGKRGPKSAEARFFTNPINRANAFGDEAHPQMETAVATEGCYILVGDDSTKEVRPIPLKQIDGVITHPDYQSEIWAYVRKWDTYDLVAGKTETKREVIYVDTFSGSRQPSFQIGRDTIAVARNKTIIDFWAQRQVGWTFGVPDTLAAIPWTQGYTELMQQGRVMTDALAKFAAKVTAKTQKGADKIGVKTSGRGAGQMAAVGQGNELDIFSSAGKTYDFGGLRPWAAMVATSLEVSIVHLLSDPGAAGNSYGSASNLDLPTKRAMVSRQNAWAAFLTRVIKWGTGEDAVVTFPTLDEPDPYREAQTVVLGWQTGAFHPEEVRDRLSTIANVEKGDRAVPTGILIPNNEKSLARNDIDVDSHGGSGDTPTHAASPDQGRSNGSGGTSSATANDLRSDKIGESVQMMRFEDMVERAERVAELLERLTLTAP